MILEDLITELETDVMLRNVGDCPEDPQSHALFIVRLEMMQADPDLKYLRGLLCSALQKPFENVRIN